MMQSFRHIKNPFDYDLGLKVISNENAAKRALICAHGYGQTSDIISQISPYNLVDEYLIAFNFPDFNNDQHLFGTVAELLPLAYVIKQCVVDCAIPTISLYGFSSGGGILVNLLAVLNEARYERELQTLGIDALVKKKILEALERGIIILDRPLKSLEEVIAMQPGNDDLALLAARYQENKLRPIDAIMNLEGLNLKVLVHFQDPDEALGNRDDAVYIGRLKNIISLKTTTMFESGLGHFGFSEDIWKIYKKLVD